MNISDFSYFATLTIKSKTFYCFKKKQSSSHEHILQRWQKGKEKNDWWEPLTSNRHTANQTDSLSFAHTHAVILIHINETLEMERSRDGRMDGGKEGGKLCVETGGRGGRVSDKWVLGVSG